MRRPATASPIGAVFLTVASLLAAATPHAADLDPSPAMPEIAAHPPIVPTAVDPATAARVDEPPAVVQFPPPAPRPGSPAALARGLRAEGAEADAPPVRAPGRGPGAPTPFAERFETRAALIIRERPLDEVLGDIAEIGGLRMRINDRVDDIPVRGERLVGTVREILDELTRRYNLVWFAERDLVDVARADTATVRTFRVDGVSDAEIRDAIARFGLINVDFALEVDERNGVARIFAPPRLAARLESIIVGLRGEDPEPTGPVDVIKFGLRDRSATN